MSWLELRVPPVAVALLTGALMWLAARALPGTVPPGGAVLAALAAVCGVALGVAGVVQFRRQRTTVNPHKPEAASSLVSGGVYRWTRNPMYLGMALLLAAWALWLGSAWAMALLPLFVAYLTRFQIVPEERVLAAKFGEAFADYRRRVRRWL